MKSTERLIFHIDVNSAFLSWESARRVSQGLPDLREIPSCVGGNPKKRTGIVVAKSIPAKKYGIQTGEPVAMALRKCPNLVIVPSDFELYDKCSRAFKAICASFAPVMESFSIDEVFLDMTGTSLIYPDPVAAAHELKDKIHRELGFTVNVGISTNKLLAKKAEKICVAYEGMERFFPADKIIMTGNPVRQNVLETTITKEEARKQFGLDPEKKTILLVGGSLGARTINESVLQHLDLVKESGVQFIWQTGKYYNAAIMEQLKGQELPMLKVTDFISDMGAAYKAADLVISRAGASSISEFCLIGKPVILVPSPNVAEDHQTKNAMALVNKDAAIYVKDADAPEVLLKKAVDTVKDEAKLDSLCENIKKLGLKNSADVIADEVIKLATK